MSTDIVNRQIKMDNVRLLRVSLTKAYTGKDAKIDPTTGKAEGKFHIDAVFPQSHPQFQQLRTLIRAVATEKWKEQTDSILGMIGKNNQRFPLQSGDQYRPGKPAYAGMLYISAGNKDQPTILVTENGVNISNRPSGQAQLGQPAPVLLTPSHPCWPYEGSYANVLLEFYTYVYGNSPGLGCSVLGVQFAKHGERLRGSSVASGSEFGLVPTDADKAPAGQPGLGISAPQTGGAGLI